MSKTLAKIAACALLLAAAGGTPAQADGVCRVESLDSGASASLPLGRYADHYTVGPGASIRLNTGFRELPLELSARLQVAYLIEDNPYLDALFSTSAVVEAGWPIVLAGGPVTLVPRLGAGFLGHVARGELNTGEPSTKHRFYPDQIYSVRLELGFTPWRDGESDARAGAYLAPGFSLFPNQGAVGTLVTLEAGVRFRLGSHETTTPTPLAEVTQ